MYELLVAITGADLPSGVLLGLDQAAIEESLEGGVEVFGAEFTCIKDRKQAMEQMLGAKRIEQVLADGLELPLECVEVEFFERRKRWRCLKVGEKLLVKCDLLDQCGALGVGWWKSRKIGDFFGRGRGGAVQNTVLVVDRAVERKCGKTAIGGEQSQGDQVIRAGEEALIKNPTGCDGAWDTDLSEHLGDQEIESVTDAHPPICPVLTGMQKDQRIILEGAAILMDALAGSADRRPFGVLHLVEIALAHQLFDPSGFFECAQIA